MIGSTERVRELLADALERPAAERAAFLEGACGGDADLRREVESLIRAHDSAGGFLGDGSPGRAPSVQEARTPPGPLAPGQTIGHYVVTGLIGEGGMGVVYAAKDKMLGRTVALKVLSARASVDAAQRSRLEREARIIANLQHPNIAAIHSVEAAGDAPMLVLEFVPGKTLAERLAHGRIAMDEAIRIAREIAMGLAAAHDAGIIHRDLKPANIKITPDRAVKILDFGVAKPMFASSQIGPVTTTPGTVIGTPAYMSPEQARGQNVDRRADMWALGTVLFEMLSGRRAFDGGTTADVLAAVIGREPDWSSLPAGTAPAIRRLLRRCLEKDLDRRLRDAGDARLELEAASLDPGAGADEHALARRYRTLAIVAGGALLGLGLAAGAILVRARGHVEPVPALATRPARFVIQAPPDAPLGAWVGGCVALSHDGRTLVYTAGSRNRGLSLFIRRLDAFEAVEVPGTLNAYAPFFSPDGQWIGYCDISSDSPCIKRVRADGGGVPEVVAAPVEGEWTAGWGTGASWGTDGTIVFSGQTPRGLRRVPASGGVPTEVTTLDTSKGERSHTQPCFLPGCDAVLFTSCWPARERFVTKIEAVRPGTGERRVVLEDAAQPMYLSRESSRLLFYRAGALWSIGFDAASLATAGEPERVLSPIAGGEPVPFARVAVSAAGTLAYLPENISYMNNQLRWFDRDGSSTLIFDSGEMPIDTLRLSPDGGAVAFCCGVPEFDVWVRDLARSTSTPLRTGGRCYFPVWTRDGRRIAFQQAASENGPFRLMWAPADGSGQPEMLFEAPGGVAVFPTEFHPDGRLAIVMETKRADQEITDLFLIDPRDPDRTAHRMFRTAEYRPGARFSPDGTLVAYTSKEKRGENQVYIQPFPALDRKVTVSVEGGFRPAWSRDGRRLFFRSGDRVCEADVTTTPELAASAPRVILTDTWESRFDVSPDGRIIMARPRDWGLQTRINVVLGWNVVEMNR